MRQCHPIVSLLPLVCGALLVCGCRSLPPSPVPRPPVGALPPPVAPTFVDETARRGLPAIAVRCVNWLDYDNDACPDLLVDGARLYHNSGPPSFLFRDVTDAVGMGQAGKGAAVCVDFDNDGWTDIATTNGRLLRNEEGGRFADVAAASAFRPHRKANVIGCGDVNGDGLADMYVAMREDWNGGNPRYYPHELWLNRGGRFEEVGRAAGIDVRRYGRCVLFNDVDGDGALDIFVGNYRLQPNLLWRNVGRCRFRDAARSFGIAGRYRPAAHHDRLLKRDYGPQWGHTIGACWLDFDNDGRLDLFVANLVHKYVGPANTTDMGYDIRGYVCDDSAVYRRVGKRFEDWRARLGVPTKPIGGPAVFEGDELWAGCAAADVNNDGWIDVYVPQIYNLAYARARLFVNRAGRGYTDVARQAGIRRIDTYAGAWADIDCDGAMDLVTAGRPARGAPSQLCLLRNVGSPDMARNRWLKVRLRQSPGARTTLGTVVRVSDGALNQMRRLSAGSSSYGQQNDPVCHFGLGPQPAAAVRVTVRWPGGTVEEHEARVNSTLELTSPPVLLSTFTCP